jgi:sigma-54-specific transcriptional regulator
VRIIFAGELHNTRRSPTHEEDCSLTPTQLLTLPTSEPPAPPWRAKASVFEDPCSRALLARIRQLAPSNVTVLVVGETGTGKEIISRHIHDLSQRAGHPFVAVNCGAFSPTLIESELFGHEKGAFTGAIGDKPGWFEAAHGGTLFLDEIGDLPLPLQVKLLRVLQEREVVRLGAKRAIPVNVRLIAATNVRLEEAVAGGTFRADLFYRVAVAKVVIAPLRERPGDILPLAHHFLDVYANARPAAGPRPALTPLAAHTLLAHSWPGNIRELENAIHYAVLVCQDGRITPDDLPLASPAAGAAPASTAAPAAVTGASVPDEGRQGLRSALDALFAEAPQRLWATLEETIMRRAYEHAGSNQLATARLLGLSRSVVRARLLEYGVLARERDEQPPREGRQRQLLAVEDEDVARPPGELVKGSGYRGSASAIS